MTSRPPGFRTRAISMTARFGISNEAKRGHRKDKVKCCIVEWQSFRLSLNKMQLSALDFGALSRSGDHRRVCIEPCYDCTTPSKFRCKRAIAAADIQQSLIGNRTRSSKRSCCSSVSVISPRRLDRHRA